MFQSSPSPKTGRYYRGMAVGIGLGYGVPILTQSENWALFCDLSTVIYLFLFQSSPSPKTGRYRSCWQHCHKGIHVPILTQSENWALSTRTRAFAHLERFQSSPSPKTGRYSHSPSVSYKNYMFQSSPSPKTGRYYKLYG